MTDRNWKEEEQRQAQELADMLQSAIHEHGRMMLEAGRPPILNAVAGAIVTVQAAMLAAIEDPRLRKAMRKKMDNTLPRALTEARTRTRSYAQTVVVGGRKH